MRGATAGGVVALVGALVLLTGLAELLRPPPEPAEPSYCRPLVDTTDRLVAYGGDGPFPTLGFGSAICGDDLADIDYMPITSMEDALTGIAVLQEECVPEWFPDKGDTGRLGASMTFAARFGRSTEPTVDATFQWDLDRPGEPDLPGKAVSEVRAAGRQAAVRSDVAFTEGEAYRWRVRPTADPDSSEPWSKWFPFTPAC